MARKRSMKLIFSKSFWLIGALMLFGTGNYTFSESHLPSSGTKSIQELSSFHLTLPVEINGIRVVVPASYYKSVLKKSITITKVKAMPSEKIMGIGIVNIDQMASFLLSNNENVDGEFAHYLAKTYFDEAKGEGVNPDIAFTQMCLETGFLRFDGTVAPEQHNYCGLGVTGNGEKGQYFTNPEEGIRAHIQHLKAYASTDKLNTKLVDNRFRFVKRGSATEISELTGKWATDVHYDKKIRGLLYRLLDND